MRQTIKEIEINMAYHWFLGYGMIERIPHFTTFGKNYLRRFADTEVRFSPEGKEVYRLRKETIERVFADAKVKHRLLLHCFCALFPQILFLTKKPHPAFA